MSSCGCGDCKLIFNVKQCISTQNTNGLIIKYPGGGGAMIYDLIADMILVSSLSAKIFILLQG